MLIINLKTYPEATGSEGADELQVIQKIILESPELKDLVFVAPQVLDLLSIHRNYPDINIIAQHVDPTESGKTTGMVTAERLRDLGVNKSLLNHSEHRMDLSVLGVSISFLKKEGMQLIVACENLDEAKNILKYDPYGIAYEPKELIGSGKSVSTEKPEVVKEFVELVKAEGSDVKAIVGAGVSTGDDVAKCVEFGANGVLVASSFVKAEDKYAKLKELILPWTQNT